MTAFTKSIHKHLGPAMTADDFEDDFKELYTPTFKPCEDEETKPLIFPKKRRWTRL